MATDATFNVKRSKNAPSHTVTWQRPNDAAEAVELGLCATESDWNELACQKYVIVVQDTIRKNDGDPQSIADRHIYSSRGGSRVRVVEKPATVSIADLDQQTIETYAALARLGKIILVDGDGNEVDPGSDDDTDESDDAS